MSNVPHNPSLVAKLALRKQSERSPCDGLRPGCYTAVLKTHHCNWGPRPNVRPGPSFFHLRSRHHSSSMAAANTSANGQDGAGRVGPVAGWIWERAA